MKNIYANTPIVNSTAIQGDHGVSVWLKMEAQQPTGSFKLRGISHACITYQKKGAQGFICASGGNAGIAVAYTGKNLGIPVTIVVPETTSQRAIDAIQKEEAHVIIHGKSYQEAHTEAIGLISKEQIYIHSFDDPLLWEGHASMIDEVKSAEIIPDQIVLSVGGGGLLCGVMEGLARNQWSHIPVLAVETHGAHSLAHALNNQNHLGIDKISSIATSLGAKKVARKAFEEAQKKTVSNHIVSDREAVAACLQFSKDHQLVVEPACGAALAPVYAGHPSLKEKKNILVIVCGGMGVGIEQLEVWNKAYNQ